MPNNADAYWKPPPPIRTSTGGSQKSQSSGIMSPVSGTLSPTSPYTRGPQFNESPTEESFFGAIASRVRRGRSRSGNRSNKPRNRSRSPLILPPEHVPSRTIAQPTNPSYATQRPQQPRHVSNVSQSSTASVPTRSSLQRERPSRTSTSSSDMWRGRHSNSWLFNDFSVRETAKDVFHMSRRS